MIEGGRTFNENEEGIIRYLEKNRRKRNPM